MKPAKIEEINKDLIDDNDLKTNILFDKSKDFIVKIKPILEKTGLFPNNLLFYNEKKVCFSF